MGLATARSRMNSRSNVLRAESRVGVLLIVTRTVPPGFTSVVPPLLRVFVVVVVFFAFAVAMVIHSAPNSSGAV
jgi:hypothetical protein